MISEGVEAMGTERDSPKILVAMPVHNSERFLPETIQSISAQEYHNLEIVISDDASTDRTLTLCDSFASNDPRVRIQRHPKRLGWIGNYNSLLKYATGDYFLWVPHDDLYEPHYVRDLVALLETRPDAVLAYSAARTIDVLGRVKGEWPGTGRMDYRGTRLLRGLRYLWWREGEKGMPFHCIVRTSALRAAGELRQIRFAADDLWLFRLALLGAFAYDPRPLCQKRLYVGSASSTYGRRFSDWNEYLIAHRDVVREAGLTGYETTVFLVAIRLRQVWLVCVWPLVVCRRLLRALKRFAKHGADRFAPGYVPTWLRAFARRLRRFNT